VLLARENKRRDAEPPDNSCDDVYVARSTRETVLRSRSPRLVSVLIGKHKRQADVTVRTRVLGFDRSTKSRLQIYPVISACCVIMGKVEVIFFESEFIFRSAYDGV
jgi:hypothetical protein